MRTITKDKDGNIISEEGTDIEFDDMPPIVKRLKTYDINAQLNALVDDIEAGHFGEAAKAGSFINLIRTIKAKYPK